VEVPAPKVGRALVRQHTGGLQESLATTVDIEPTLEALATSMSESLGVVVKPRQITVKPYGYDSRIDWNTYIIVIKKLRPDGTIAEDGSVYGFSNVPILPE